ncbi:glycosyltransferase family 8 protein [Sphingobacterium corticis]|uniref:Glycosyltransferase family 8 protein n=1 Tax=Sphingobacterium corticis TaxID=1812823 RepID=A0ABW5NGQ0_9SPHI
MKAEAQLAELPIVISFNQSYIVPAAVVISSTLDHLNSNAEVLFFCLLSEDLTALEKQYISELGNARTTFVFHVVSSSLLANVDVDLRYGLAAYYRIFLPEILNDYKKVIYLDCDIVVRNDLAKVYHTIKLDEHYLAAVFEAMLPFQVAHLEEIGCPTNKYFNSGFLIMNLEKMRQENVSRKLLGIIQSRKLEFPDQDALNIICSHKTIGLPPFFNSIRTFWLPQYKSAFLNLYKEEDWKAVQEHGTVHYTGSKPWNSFTIEFDVWWNYFDRLPKNVKQYFPFEQKWHLLSKIYRTHMGKLMIDGSRSVFRYFRKNGE